MPRTSAPVGQTCFEVFQLALDSADMIGQWAWDPATDRARVDALVALLFAVDPTAAEAGIPPAIDGGHQRRRPRPGHRPDPPQRRRGELLPRRVLVDITELRAREETGGAAAPGIGETPLDRAVAHALAAQDAVVALGDPALKAGADALLMALGRRLLN